MTTKEQVRIEESRQRRAHWNRWGPFLSDRAWGTVREDYSPDGSAWDYFTFDQARSRVYRWNEDGLLGICDRHQRICFALALWNGRDPMLKERLFGLTGDQGNHGEDVKEYYFYLDNTPTHSYMKGLYKYPQAGFPYAQLVAENRKRSRSDPEYELGDTGVFRENRYFDVFVEYAKAAPDDILIRIEVFNRGPETAALHVLPTVWFRNRWSWGYDVPKPELRKSSDTGVIELEEPSYGKRWLYCAPLPVGQTIAFRRLSAGGSRPLLPTLHFTENESNCTRLWGTPSLSPYVKDGIDECIVQGNPAAVNPQGFGTKAAADYALDIEPGKSAVIELRFTDTPSTEPFGADFDRIFQERIDDANDFYATVTPREMTIDGRAVMRQAFAGLLWSKQFYHYVVRDWLRGDPAFPPPPPERRQGRNHEWTHLYNADVISMPDKWEYPWYAAWDLAFHCLPLALVDSEYAKDQLALMVREWYLHPNGQLPAYEWNLGDVNPPVHAWAAWRVYKIEQKRRGKPDRAFLERIFHKMLLNFTWWVNRKDAQGNNVFQGGFLGLDNIGLFNRSEPLPGGEFIEQADGTGWMAMYSLNLLAIALELAREDSAYEDVASKFWEHFLFIANAINHLGDDGAGMWDEGDGFFYDVLHFPDGRHTPLKVRSLVGLIPVFAVETLEPRLIDRFPGFKRRMQWFIENRGDLTHNVASMVIPGKGERRLLSIVNAKQLRRILTRMLDEEEFLSPFGIRSVSRAHKDHPCVIYSDGTEHCVSYEPGESLTGLFGGNSNWRGPVWFPVNYLIIEALQKFHHYLGDEYKVECPTRSGRMMTLWEVAAEISRRLSRLFLKDENGRRPAHGSNESFHTDPGWKDLVLFYEYFHGETGAGLGASHQTGWTGLAAKLLQQSGE
ncbi:MAG: glucosidase [Acidobacteriia bacterium]|nr:glucosidase [Terriglobia bacterium]